MLVSLRSLCSYLGDGEAALATGNHLVPLVVQHVHEAVRLVLADQLRDVGGERRVLREADPVTCRQRHTAESHYFPDSTGARSLSLPGTGSSAAAVEPSKYCTS